MNYNILIRLSTKVLTDYVCYPLDAIPKNLSMYFSIIFWLKGKSYRFWRFLVLFFLLPLQLYQILKKHNLLELLWSKRFLSFNVMIKCKTLFGPIIINHLLWRKCWQNTYQEILILSWSTLQNATSGLFEGKVLVPQLSVPNERFC